MTNNQVVHVVDDDADVRQSIAFLVGTAGHAVRMHASAEAFLEAQPAAQDGCVVTDIRMPGIDGLQLQRLLKQRGSSLPVIVITGHGDVPLAVEAMKAGAVDFIEKPFEDDALLQAIDVALARHASRARRDAEVADIRVRIAQLTRRELAVLDGLVAGKSNKIIAHDLGISPRTVEVYRANLMTKMRADSLSQLIKMALHGRRPE